MPILLFLLFIVVPVVELFVIIQVGEFIGLLPTVILLLVVSVLGSWLIRREGMRAWRAFRAALAHGRVPTSEVVDGALVLFGGALLLTPGFVTDLLGLALVFPLTRGLVNRAIRARVRPQMFLGPAPTARPTATPRRPARPRRGARDPDVDVQVLDVRRSSEDRPESR